MTTINIYLMFSLAVCESFISSAWFGSSSSIQLTCVQASKIANKSKLDFSRATLIFNNWLSILQIKTPSLSLLVTIWKLLPVRVARATRFTAVLWLLVFTSSLNRFQVILISRSLCLVIDPSYWCKPSIEETFFYINEVFSFW